jgi:prolyl 4-hydroxylase
MRLTDELLEIVPDHVRAKGNKFYYQQALDKIAAKQRKGEDGSDDSLEDQV